MNNSENKFMLWILKQVQDDRSRCHPELVSGSKSYKKKHQLVVLANAGIQAKLTCNAFVFFIFILFLFSSTQLMPLSVGSSSAYSRQAFITFPQADTDNTMLGFAAFEGGFSLGDGATTCTFDSLLPASGTTTLAGGTLVLNRDFSLANQAVFPDVGTVWGKNLYAFDLPPTNTLFNLPMTSYADTYVTAVAKTLTVNSIGWSYDNTYLAIATNYTLGGANPLSVYTFNGSTLTLAASVAIGSNANCVDWYPSGYYVALVRNTSTTGIRVYLFNPGAGTLTQTGSLTLGAAGWSCKWHRNRPFLAIGSASTTAEIRLASFNTGTGAITSIQTIDLTPNRITPRNGLAWGPAGYNTLAVGTSRPSLTQPILVYTFNGASLTLSSSADAGAAVGALDWSPTSSIIAVGLTGTTERLRLYYYNRTAPSLTEIQSARVGVTRSVSSIIWDSTGKFLRIGAVSGGGVELNETYYFDTKSATLTKVEGTTSGIGANDLAWTPDNNYFAEGDVLNVRVRNSYFNRPLIFKDARLNIQSPTLITQQVRFIGQCTVYGNGNAIRLGDGASISVAPQSVVSLQEMALSGVGGSDLICFDDSATLGLTDCKINFERDFTFSSGGMLITGDVTFSGTNKFNYTSGQTSSVDSNAMLYFDRDFTFSYAPRRARTNLINFADATSMFYLNGCSLVMSRTGFDLNQGTIVFDNKVTMSSQAKNSGEAAIISPNAAVQLSGGVFVDLYGKFKFQ